PDADAICSAIGYAAFKKAAGFEGFVAARCGNVNERVNAILQRFGMPAPLFLSDVAPRARDVMTASPHTVTPGHTCAEALELIDRHDVNVLPVVDAGGKLLGMISVFDLGDHFIPKPRDQREMRHVHASMADIVRSLHAETLFAVDEDRLEDLYVRVGAMDIRSFGNFTHDESTPASQSIIVVGDRYDIQMKSISAGVRLLVITGRLQPDSEIVQMARDKGVCLIVSPYDSATTAWIIRSANRVERMYSHQTISFGPDERLTDIRRRIAANPPQACMVCDEDGKLVGLFTKSDLLKPPGTRLVLVDHNELTQAVPGADQVQIAEIIDHHRLGNPHSSQPILFFNEPVGSTSTIVADCFRRSRLEPDRATAGILMSGIISDTLKLRSPTTTARDGEILNWLSGIAGQNIDELAAYIFSSGSVIMGRPAAEVIRNDMKVYREGSLSFSVSQVEELGFDPFWDKREALETALAGVREREGLDFAALLVTDINRQDSLLLLSGPREIVDGISYPRVESHEVFELTGIVSRKKQLVPYLSALIANLG
ncbi:MAG TPA: putative manganese-dependent inorganic diphosphatase, partial [Opitutales bacterium]|nr:putative manganese-dependent inorganic diphosphatase [Opitutales bacterium]